MYEPAETGYPTAKWTYPMAKKLLIVKCQLYF